MPATHEPPDRIEFQPWTDPGTVTAIAVESSFCRTVWLPILGPAAWVLWATLATQLGLRPLVRWPQDRLVHAVEFGRPSQLERALERLARFELATPDGDLWLIRPYCPRLSATQLRRSPGWVRSLHDRTFPHPGTLGLTTSGRVG